MTVHRPVYVALRAVAMLILVAAGLTPGVAAHATVAPDAAGHPAATPPGASGDIDGDEAPAPAGTAGDVTSEPSASVAPAVTEAFEDKNRVSVLIRLRAQADLDALAEAADHAATRAEAAAPPSAAAGHDDAAHDRADQARASEVTEGLQGVAEGPEHAEIESVLRDAESDGRAEGIEAYWIVNAFAATVDEDTVDTLAEHPAVEWVQLDEVTEVPEVTSEPLVPTWSLDAVQAPRAWAEHDHRGDDVVVAIMDSGVDGGHPALAESYRGADGDHSDSWFVATGENYPTPFDGNGHGTHVAGSVVGDAPGQVTGVAPDAEWVGVKIFDDAGQTTDSAILSAAQWLLAPGGDPAKAPDVVNNSWSHPSPTHTMFWDSVEAWRAAGIFPVFANANNGPGDNTVGSPASFPHSFGVGATDVNDQIASFSSRGPAVWDGEEIVKPDVSAPGHQILSAWPRNLGQDYNTISGTSMAAPHVAGAVALLLSANPDLSVDEVWTTLEQTARVTDDMGEVPNNAYGHGIINTYAATTLAAHAGRLTGTVTGPDGPVEVPVTVSVDDGDFTTTADPETGSYAVTVPSGGAEVTVTAFGYVEQTFTVEVPTGADDERDIVLAAAPSATVSGTISADGAGVSHAVVRVLDTDVSDVVTDADGGYTMTLPHGTYDLRVDRRGYLPESTTIEVDGDVTADLSLTALTTPAEAGWAQAGNNPARTGQTTEVVAPSTFTETWSAELPGAARFASPVVADGRLFAASETSLGGNVVALDAESGDRLWTHDSGGTQRTTPAATDDAVYLTDGDTNQVLALDPATGEELWAYSTGDERTVYGSPAVLEGTVYISTGMGEGNGGFVHALDAATGERLWRAEIGPQAAMGPAVGDGVVVGVSWETGVIRALDAETGERLWEYAHPTNGVLAMPVIAAGAVYVGTSGDNGAGSMLALDLGTGAVKWEATDHGDAQASSAAVYGDLVIAGSHGRGNVLAYDRTTGEVVWSHDTVYAVTSPQVVTADGVVLGGSQSNLAFALDATSGDVLWEADFDSPILSAPAIADGTVYLTTMDGTVRAYGSSGTITGTLSGPEGPIQGHIEITETGEGVATSEDGTFSVEHRPGPWTLRASAYGYTARETAVEIVGGQQITVDLTLDVSDLGALTGTVTAADEGPIAATVRVLGADGEPVVDPVTAAADGTYAVPDLAAGTYRVRVEAEGYAPHDASVTVDTGGPTGYDVTLHRFDAAVVADHEGQVAAVLRGHDRTVDALTFDEAVEAGAAIGRYGAVVLVGTPQDPATVASVESLVDAADEAGVSMIALDQAGADTGSVAALMEVTNSGTVGEETDWRGTAWADDVAEHPMTAALSTDGETELLTAVDVAWVDDYTGRSLARGVTYSAGEHGTVIGYEPRSLTNAHVVLPLHAPTEDANPHTTWRPVMGDILDDAVAWAGSAEFGRLGGTVSGPDGPLTAATVTLTDGPTITTDESGYTMLVDPGTYTVTAQAPGFATQERSITIEAGQEHTLDWSLEPTETGSVSGTVTDQTGAPVAGAEMTLDGAGTEPVTTDDDGAYLITDVPTGTWTLTGTAEGHTTGTRDGVVVEAGTTTTADLVLGTAPSVAVIGDDDTILTDFLTARDIPAVATDWSITDDLSSIDVAIIALPRDPGEDAFRAHLQAFEDAGVAVIASGGINAYTLNGAYLFQEYLGDPGEVRAVGGGGQNLAVTADTPHPVFAGLPAEVPWDLMYGGEAAAFNDHSGVPIATITADGQETRGPGAIYYPADNDTVHVLAGGLGSTFRIDPEATWTEDGKNYYLNLIRWAADPDLGGVDGTVTGPGGIAVPEATITFPELGFTMTTDESGQAAQRLHTGTYDVTYTAHGYAESTATVTVPEGGNGDLSVEMTPAAGGSVTGTVHSTGQIGTGAADEVDDGLPLEGATVQVMGLPRETTTDADGTYELPYIEPGDYRLEITAADHLREIVDVTVVAGEITTHDQLLLVSPVVGVLDDFAPANRPTSVEVLLETWGYKVTEITWDDPEALSGIDILVANGATYGNEPTAGQFAAFDDALNRHGISTLWMGTQFGRGGLQYLSQQTGDPAVEGDGDDEGDVTAVIADGQGDHPILAGIDGDFPLVQTDGSFQWFDDYSGTTIASLETAASGVLGDTIAVKGRTTEGVDILLSTMATSSNGQPTVPGYPSYLFTPEAEQVYRNSLRYAMDATDVGAEARGTVRAGGEPAASTVTVAETGHTYPGRDGDGTFVVPLAPGTWTLHVDAYGYERYTREVTVAAGDVATVDVALTGATAGTIAGTVTDATGEPLGQVTAHVGDRVTTTAADGTYALPQIPVGEAIVEFSADGYRTESRTVTVPDGGTVTVDLAMAEAAQVALVGDRNTDMYDVLVGAGYEVDTFAYRDIAEVIPVVADYDTAFVNGYSTAPSEEDLAAFIDAADAAEVSILFGGQYYSGSIRHLNEYFGDPETVNQGGREGPVGYTVTAEHPILSGFEVGETITLLDRDGRVQYQAFDGYSGVSLAETVAPDTGEVFGGGLAYRFSSPGSAHILLGNLVASAYGSPAHPSRWTSDAYDIVLNAVAWSVEASQSVVTGTVTSEGEPVGGATVTAVEAAVTATTASDGSFRLGLPPGTHTVNVTRTGYEPAEDTVTVDAGGTTVHDVDLTPQVRGAADVSVVEADGGAGIAGATVTATGPIDARDTTGADGTVTLGDLVPGEYTLDVSADGHLDGTTTVEVTSAETATATVELQVTDVVVLGDTDASEVTAVLVDDGIGAAVADWATVSAGLEHQRTVVVNGGDPTEEEFDALITAADEHEVDVIFLGTHRVAGGGGTELLATYGEGYERGGEGYGDGPVALTGFDPDHPLFAGLDDPAAVLADDAYYDLIGTYDGDSLADLAVGADEDGPAATGTAIAYEFRGATDMHLVLGSMGASQYQGPGRGWTEQSETLLLNAVAWVDEAELAPPAAPTVTTGSTLVANPEVTVSGVATDAESVTVEVDGQTAAEVVPDADDTFTAELSLAEGANEVVAVATNAAGSARSEPLVITVDTAAPELAWTSPAEGTAVIDPRIEVTGTVTDDPAGVDAVTVNGEQTPVGDDGAFTAEVDLVEGANPITVSATDTVGNTVTEERTVIYYALDIAVELPSAGGLMPVIATVTDADGQAVQVDGAELAAYHDGELLLGPRKMRWTDDEFYRGVLRGMPPRIDEVDVVITVSVDGHEIVVKGGTISR